jgi:hypothetical protein
MAEVKLEAAVVGCLTLNREEAFLAQLPSHPGQVLLATSWAA